MYYIAKVLEDFFQENKLIIIAFFICNILYQPMYTIIIPKIFTNFFETLTLHKNSSYEILKKICISFLIYYSVMQLILNAIDIFIKYLKNIIIPSLTNYLGSYLFKNLLKQRENNYSEIDISKVFMYLSDVPYDVLVILNDSTKILPNILAITTIVCYLFYVNINLGFTSLILFICTFYISYYNFPRCIPQSEERQNATREKMTSINDKLSNLSNIFSSGYMEEEIFDFENTSNRANEASINAGICLLSSSKITSISSIVIIIILFCQSCYLCVNKKISTSEVIAVILIISKIGNASNEIVTVLPNIINLITSLSFSEPTTKNLYETAEMEKLNTKKSIQIKNGNILFHNLKFKYNNTDNYLIENFFLEIPHGQKIAIMGNSGGGKSTIVKLLMGYYPVSDDIITVDNTCINKYNLSELRKQITFINQNTRLFNDTVLKNIQYGNNMTREDIMNHIKRTKTFSIFETLSDGLDTPCGINGEYLSGGQKQLVHFIKNIERNNKIVVLDEPTAAVDSANTQNILDAISELAKYSTLIVITHDKNVLRIVDRVITINDGKIVNDVYTKN